MDPADPDDVADDVDGTVAGTLELDDGTELPVALDGGMVEAAQEAGVDPQRLADAAMPDQPVPADAVSADLTAQVDQDDTATIPVQDRQMTDLANRLRRDRDFRFIRDDQIQRLQRQGVNYTERVGEFLLARDDLIPTIKERLKALIVGEEGIEPEPEDPNSDADQRLADHMADLYDDEIRPGDVIDTILRENIMSARAVLRARDLAELDLNTLDFFKDGVSGEEVYLQDRTTVYEIVPEDEDQDPDDATQFEGLDLERRTFDPQVLVIGDHVFDISLYDEPPLEAVADTAVNKMVMQRLKARKAEITSFGAVYAKVEPPSYLPEDQYFDRVQDDSGYDEGDQPPTKLERAMRNNIQKAFDTLKDFQSGTTMAIPDFWTLEQLEIPDTGEPLDEQIRGYNRDIARRLLVPLDLIELESGSELSRETLFMTLMTTIAGWRQEIARVFDRFAQTQADIHDIDGTVEHTFPPLRDANTKQVISALQYAGLAGLSQEEVRKMMNTVQGIDLDTDGSGGPDMDDEPPEGGPDDPGERARQMQNFLDEQRRGDTGEDQATDQAGQQAGQDGAQPAEAQDADVDLSIPEAVQNAAQQALDARDDDDVTVQGMTDRGWRRAEQLASGGELTRADILGGSDGMAVWWARHAGHTLDTTGDQTTLKGADQDNPWADNSYTAGKGWGGVAGARFAFQKAAQLTDGEDADDWRDWVDEIQAAAPTQDTVTSPPRLAAAEISDGAAEVLRRVPFFEDPDGPGEVRITKDQLAAYWAWVQDGKPDLRIEGREWNPALHPRGPDGKFVERPYDIPDDLLDEAGAKSSAELMKDLIEADELSAQEGDELLTDDSVRIDGLEDVNDMFDLEKKAQEDREERLSDDGGDEDGDGDTDDEPIVGLDDLEVDDPRIERIPGETVSEGDIVQVQPLSGADERQDFLGRVSDVSYEGGLTKTVQKKDGGEITLDGPYQVGGQFTPYENRPLPDDVDLDEIDVDDPDNWADRFAEEGDIVRLSDGDGDLTTGYIMDEMTMSGGGRAVRLENGETVRTGVDADSDLTVLDVFDEGGSRTARLRQELVIEDDLEPVDLTELDGSPAERREGIDVHRVKSDAPEITPEDVQEGRIPEGAYIGRDDVNFDEFGRVEEVTGQGKLRLRTEDGRTSTISSRRLNTSSWKPMDPRRETDVNIDQDLSELDRQERADAIKDVMDDITPKINDHPDLDKNLDIPDEQFEQAKRDAALELAKHKHQDQVEDFLGRLRAIGDDKPRASASPDVDAFGRHRTQYQLQSSNSYSTSIHEMGHAFGMANGFAGSVALQGDDVYPAPSFRWEKQDHDVISSGAVSPPKDHEQYDRSTYLTNQDPFKLEDWEDTVDQEVGQGLDGRNFTSFDPQDVPEDGMIYLDDEPSYNEPRAWSVVDVEEVETEGANIRAETARVTLEDKTGRQVSGVVEDRFDGRIAWDDDAPFIGNSRIQGSRQSTPDDWRPSPPDPDDHLGEGVPDDVTPAEFMADRVNKSWYRHAAASREMDDSMARDWFLVDGYTAKEAHEAFSRIHQVMRGDDDRPGPEGRAEADGITGAKLSDAAETLVTKHPDLLEAYRANYEIPQEMKAELNVALDQNDADYRFT